MIEAHELDHSMVPDTEDYTSRMMLEQYETIKSKLASIKTYTEQLANNSIRQLEARPRSTISLGFDSGKLLPSGGQSLYTTTVKWRLTDIVISSFTNFQLITISIGLLNYPFQCSGNGTFSFKFEREVDRGVDIVATMSNPANVPSIYIFGYPE